MASALMRDIGYLEVGLRNAYDRFLLGAASADWADDPSFALFRTASGPGRSANLVKLDAEETELRALLQSARDHVGGAGRGKIVAELMFGFWWRLTSRPLTASLWTPYLHTAFPPGTNRSQIHGSLINLNSLRNRVAHHEPLFTPNVHLSSRLDEIENLLRALSPTMAAWVIETSDCRTQFNLAPIQIGLARECAYQPLCPRQTDPARIVARIHRVTSGNVRGSKGSSVSAICRVASWRSIRPRGPKYTLP